MAYTIRTSALLLVFIIITGCSSEPQQQAELAIPPAVPVDTTLGNGLSIRDMELGTGIPVDSGYYFTAHYTGYLDSGEIFDSSYERNTPINFQLGMGQVIQAWEIGIKGMRTGGKRTITTPAELAYGSTGIPGIIPADAILRFEIELLRVIQPPESWELPNRSMNKTRSGIEYVILSNGSGDKPENNDDVVVNYSGYLGDGTLFDSSYLREEPFKFKLGTGYVIRGWEEVIADMRPGEKRTVFIPAGLAYNEAGIPGIIPPGATLRFDIELIEVITTNS